MFVRTLFRAAVPVLAVAFPVVGQAHIAVRLVHPSAEQFAFQPATITARPGDVLEFTVESGGPYVIGFEPADLAPRERALLDTALPDHSASLRTGILPRPGSRLQLVVPDLPRGTYRFAAVTHIAYRMTGVLVVP
jgi:plastocyanin